MADNYLERRMEDYLSGKLRGQLKVKSKKKSSSKTDSIIEQTKTNSVNRSAKIESLTCTEKNEEIRIESLSYNLSGVGAFVAVPVREIISEEEMCGIIKNLATIPVQTHSVDVAIVENQDDVYEADALVTFKKDLAIGVKTADCVPLVIYCPDVKGIAAVHAGWRGTLNGIVDRTVDLLIEKGASPECMVVFFGPSISKDVYEVDRELADKFIEAGFSDYVSSGEAGAGNPHVDLQGINKERLTRRGVFREDIILHHGCTYSAVSHDGKSLYPSYRRTGGSPARLLTAIYLK